MKIGMKIAVGFGVVIALLIIISGIGIYELGNVTSNYQDQVLNEVSVVSVADRVDVNLLQVRRSEKDFLKRKDPKYLTRVNLHLDLADSLAKSASLYTSDEEYLSKFKLIAENVATYKSEFALLAKDVYSRGITENDGIQGVFREAAHNFEEEVKKYPVRDGMILYLTSRKHEKDYMLRLTDKYVGRLDDTIKLLKINVGRSGIGSGNVKKFNSLLDTYQSGFLSLVRIDNSIASRLAKAKAAADDAMGITAELIDVAEVNSEQMKNDIESSASTSTIILWIVSIVAIFLSVAAAYYLAMLITKPIKEITEFANSFGKGDLSISIDIDTDDEIGEMAEYLSNSVTNFNNIMTELKSMTNTLSNSSESLIDVSTQLSGSAHDMNTKSGTVAAAAEESSSAVGNVAAAAEQSSSVVINISAMTEELSSTFDNVAQLSKNSSIKVNEMASSSKEMANNVNSVAAAIEEMSSSFTDVVKSTEKANAISQNADVKAKEINDKMAILHEASQKIGKVIEVIKDIADQTNMLALNATIEAAGAGEAGKGFAVVAGEVKELAKQSAEATEEIVGQIEHVQKSTNEVVAGIEEIGTIITDIASINGEISNAINQQNLVTQELAGNVAESAKLAQSVSENSTEVSGMVDEIAKSTVEASKTASEVAKNVDETAVSVKSIAVSSNEMAASVTEISSNVQQISASSSETATGAEKVKSSANDLSGLAESLNKVVNQFTLR